MGQDLSVLEQYTDISQAPIGVGDWVFIRDDDTQQKHKFEVVAVLTEKTAGYRNYRMMVLESSTSKLPPGKILPSFEIPRDKIVWGCVIRYADRNRRYDEYEINEIAAVELRKFLDNLDKDNYRARFKTCVVFLQTNNILPPGDPDGKEIKDKLRSILRQRQELFWSKGGWVGSTGTSYRSRVAGPSGNQGTDIRIIDFRKYVMAERLRFECGFYGNVKLINVE
jgi:hypothetical protein